MKCYEKQRKHEKDSLVVFLDFSSVWFLLFTVYVHLYLNHSLIQVKECDDNNILNDNHSRVIFLLVRSIKK